MYNRTGTLTDARIRRGKGVGGGGGTACSGGASMRTEASDTARIGRDVDAARIGQGKGG